MLEWGVVVAGVVRVWYYGGRHRPGIGGREFRRRKRVVCPRSLKGALKCRQAEEVSV